MNKLIPPVSTEEINKFTAAYPLWVFVEDSLQASFEFVDFEDTVRVINLVAGKASELNHHPFWSNEYNKLAFILSTHDAADKVTCKDLELALAIQEIVTS
jgi:4a-hydroxytetrahydrobiopterin dehydratase